MTGNPVDAMLALASEAHVDAIVSGTHGKTVLDRFIGGSISEDLLASADRPNMFCRFGLLRNAADPADLARGFGRALVLTTDFSEPSVRATELALELGKHAIGTLYVLHVIDPTVADDPRRTAEEDAEVATRRRSSPQRGEMGSPRARSSAGANPAARCCARSTSEGRRAS